MKILFVLFYIFKCDFHYFNIITITQFDPDVSSPHAFDSIVLCSIHSYRSIGRSFDLSEAAAAAAAAGMSTKLNWFDPKKRKQNQHY